MTYLARIYVTLKPAVSDPAGQTVLAALQRMGHGEAEDARLGKYLELRVKGMGKAGSREIGGPHVPGTPVKPGNRGLPVRA